MQKISITMMLVTILNLLALAGLIYAAVLAVKALRRYLRGVEVRKEKRQVCRTLGEAIRAQRVRCRMTQEFVAEHLGVSRQAVSKWESGASDPSTANLLALSRLFGVSAQELLGEKD